MANAVCTFDFTINNLDKWNVDTVKEKLREIAKEWVFQKEIGEKTHHEHFQGRLSLKVKKRHTTLCNETKDWGWCWSITSNENKDNNFYVMKPETKIDGPWSSAMVERYIPKQYRIEKLYGWQEKVGTYEYDTRKINVLNCKIGNQGKSTIAHITRLTKNGVVLPCVNDAKQLIESCCDILMAKELREEIIIFIDMPRAMTKERLYGMWSAVETIKSGYVYDMRNKYKEWDFDSPTIWVFTNEEPDRSLLSGDRWEMWDMTFDGDYHAMKNRRDGTTI